MNVVGCHTSILVFNLLLVLSVQYVVSTETPDSENLFPFLGYIQGFKLGQNFALELPPFVLSPIIILPPMNGNQYFVPEANNNKNYNQTRNISYSKLSSHFTSEPETERNEKINELNHTDFPLKEKRLAESEIATDSLRKAVGDDSDNDGTTEINEALNTTSTTDFNNIENVIIINDTTKITGPYPSALYNNTFLNNLTITTQQIETNFTVPRTGDNPQNLSLSSNISNMILSNNNDTNKSAEFTIFPTTQSTLINNLYPYSNAMFNSMIDKLSITTNPYLDEGSNLPPSYDDRWQRFSSLTKLYPNSGFRPLAGLYYDGFLHKSLNKRTGFTPFDGNKNYYE